MQTSNLAMIPMTVNKYAIPFKIPGSQEDRQLIHYFCVRCSRDLAGPFHTDFWTKIVLQHSHRSPVVRQALASLGSAHRDYLQDVVKEDNIASSVTLERYDKALRALRRCLNSAESEVLDTAITCCAIFYCFEVARCNSQAAIVHLESGLNIISYQQKQGGHKFSDNHESVVHLLMELDVQATMFNDDRIPRLNSMLAPIPDSIANPFSALIEAHMVLIRLQNLLLGFLVRNIAYKELNKESLPPSVLLQKGTLLRQFDIWLISFEAYKSEEPQDTHTSAGIDVILSQWQVLSMLLDADYPPNSAVFGARPNHRAHRVLSCIENALVHMARTSEWRSLSIGNGVVASLFILSMKCSDEHVRARATKLLASSRRREGLYDAEKMLTVVERFTEAKRETTSEQFVGTHEPSSLEKDFEHHLDGLTCDMDKIADGLPSVSIG